MKGPTVTNSENQNEADLALQATVVDYSDIGPDDRRGNSLMSGGLDVVKNVVVKVEVLAGHTSVSVGDLLALQEGQVLRLDSQLDAPMQITLEGQPIASGQLMAVGDHFAIRVIDTVRRS